MQVFRLSRCNTRFPAEAYQTIVINLPKGRKLARRWLVEAWSALQPGGELYLAGANPEGIQSVIQDAGSLFGNATVLALPEGLPCGAYGETTRSR